MHCATDLAMIIASSIRAEIIDCGIIVYDCGIIYMYYGIRTYSLTDTTHVSLEVWTM